jgi:hypothetical protein
MLLFRSDGTKRKINPRFNPGCCHSYPEPVDKPLGFIYLYFGKNQWLVNTTILTKGGFCRSESDLDRFVKNN